MEGMLHGNDFMIRTPVPEPCILSCSFNRALDCLRSGVCEKYLAHAAGLRYFSRCLRHRNIVVQIGGMNNMVDLVLQCVIVFPVSVSQAENSDACRKIQIFFPIRVI